MTEAASTPAPQPPAAPPKRGRRALVWGLSGLGVVVVALLLVFLYLQAPVARSDYHDPVDARTRSTNTALYAALVAGGIRDPFVDTSSARAYVAYTIPNASLARADTFQRFVVGAAADASPNSTEIHAFQFIDANPHQLWVVQMADFLAYVRGDLDAAGLEARIARTTF